MPFGVWSMIAKRSSLVMALLLVLPQAALALGLGTIHLKSHLDQPLDARIELLDATPGALQSLSVGLASQATFARYKLNWPAYLNGVKARVTRGSNGHVVLHLTSRRPVTDPILTLLVKASWDRGVLFREYTILLNPPVYVPNASQPHHVAIAAPVVGNAPRVGALPKAGAAAVSPPAAPSAAVAPAATPAAVASQGPRSVHVHSGNTLSGIASRFSGGGMDSARTRQWMVAIYRLNPRAFAHNMNLLRAGAVLHIPASSAAAKVPSAAAWREVTRQDSAWRAGHGTGTSAAGRLRLVAPHGSATGASAKGSSAAVGALQAKVSALQSKLAHEKRLLQVKSAALSALQAQMAAAGKKAPAAAAAHKSAAAHKPVPTAHKPATAAQPAPAATRPAAAAHKPVTRPGPHPAPVVAHPAAPGVLAQTLRRYWWALALLVVLLGAYVLARLLHARRESAADERLSESADANIEPDLSLPIEPMSESHHEDAIDVHETTHEHPHLAATEPPSPVVATHVAADQTISSETALNLEQGDPLAEADFHMAYGLYDQAADLIRIAIQREPERRDLKLKLLEVFFVWGNKDQFVEMARELADSRDHAAAGEWDKIVIMGRQLAPDDPLFADSQVSGAASEGVDLDLEGGQGRVDFDVMGNTLSGLSSPTQADAGGTGTTGSFDLDIGAALGEEEPAADTVAGTDLNATVPDLETTGSETGVTQEMVAQPTQEMPAVEPTVEQPALHMGGQSALREKVEALSQGSERTAELAIDDLGLDLGAFETTVQPGLGSDADAPTMVAGLPGLENDADAPTMVAGLDERSRELLKQAEQSAASEPPAAPGSTGTTSSWQIDERELESLLAAEPEGAEHDASQTSRLTALDVPAAAVDFDLGGEEKSAVKPNGGNGLGGNGLDFDIGTATFAHSGLIATQDAPAPEQGMSDLEPVTSSEVGTKLDLARAYMDMGDPDGARSILEEVVHEGSDAQRQEAGRLLESLPG